MLIYYIICGTLYQVLIFFLLLTDKRNGELATNAFYRWGQYGALNSVFYLGEVGSLQQCS